MLKTKYQTLTKEEKKEAAKKYYNTEQGKENKSRFTRLLIIGILCIIWGIVIIIDNLIQDGSIWEYVSAILVIIFGFVFLIGRIKIKNRNINNYLTKKKK